MYRKYTYEKELANTSWKVKWNDITFSSKVTRRFGGSRMSLVSVSANTLKTKQNNAPFDFLLVILNTVLNYVLELLDINLIAQCCCGDNVHYIPWYI